MDADDRVVPSIGGFLSSAGRAAEGLGLDVQGILEDPGKAEQYARLTIAVLLTAVAWHRADEIKYAYNKTVRWLIENRGDESVYGPDWMRYVRYLFPAVAFGQAVFDYATYTGDMKHDEDDYVAKAKEYEKKYATWASDMAHLEKMIAEGTPGTATYEMNVKVYNELRTKIPQRPMKPSFMSASVEDRIIIASAVFILAMHPELIGTMMTGLGTIIRGVGEIIPL